MILLLALSPVKANGQLRIVEKEYDLGIIPEEGEAKVSALLINDGEAEVGIKEIREGCGCTTALADKEIILPGDTALLKITYNPLGRPGEFNRKIKIFLSDTPVPEEIVIKGRVKASVATLNNLFPVEAGDLRLDTKTIMMGNISPGKSRKRGFTVYNSGDSAIVINISGDPELKFEETEVIIQPAEKRFIDATLMPSRGKDYGRYELPVRFRVKEGEREEKEVLLNVVYNLVNPQISDSPGPVRRNID